MRRTAECPARLRPRRHTGSLHGGPGRRARETEDAPLSSSPSVLSGRPWARPPPVGGVPGTRPMHRWRGTGGHSGGGGTARPAPAQVLSAFFPSLPVLHLGLCVSTGQSFPNIVAACHRRVARRIACPLTTRQTADVYVIVWMKEERDGVAIEPRRIDHAVLRRRIPVIRPPGHQFADVADERTRDRRYVHPLAGTILKLQAADIVLRQDGQVAVIRM